MQQWIRGAQVSSSKITTVCRTVFASIVLFTEVKKYGYTGHSKQQFSFCFEEIGARLFSL